MNNAELFLSELRALRLQLLATAQIIENALELASRPSDEPTADQHRPCAHPIPMRVPAPAMGHATRFRCRACDQELEDQ